MACFRFKRSSSSMMVVVTHLLPLVEALAHEHAALAGQQATEHRLLLHSLAPCIELHVRGRCETVEEHQSKHAIT